MRINEAREKMEREIQTPVDHDTVLRTMGDVEIECPAGGARSIEEVLSNDRTRTYSSISELHDSLMSNLGEDYVGRKYYDDRGPNNDADVVSF